MSNVKFIQTDGGRKENGFESEAYDCTVRALVPITGLTYSTCHDLARRAGRMYGRKTQMSPIIRLADSERKVTLLDTIGYWSRPTLQRPTVAQWLRMPGNDSGKFIVRVNGHVFAVVNGECFDTCPMRMGRRVTHVWKFA